MMKKPGQKYDRKIKKKAVELSIARGNARKVAGELSGAHASGIKLFIGLKR